MNPDDILYALIRATKELTTIYIKYQDADVGTRSDTYLKVATLDVSMRLLTHIGWKITHFEGEYCISLRGE